MIVGWFDRWLRNSILKSFRFHSIIILFHFASFVLHVLEPQVWNQSSLISYKKQWILHAFVLTRLENGVTLHFNDVWAFYVCSVVVSFPFHFRSHTIVLKTKRKCPLIKTHLPIHTHPHSMKNFWLEQCYNHVLGVVKVISHTSFDISVWSH